jgi:uncharacterized protein
MKWEGQRQSENVEDRRGEEGSGRPGMPGMPGMRLGGRGIGVGTIVVALLAGWIFGINPLTVLSLLSGGGAEIAAPSAQAPAHKPPAADRQATFVSTVLADTEDVWGKVLGASGSRYEPPKLVLFTGRTPTACGGGDAAMGPFYCPGDRKVYIDLAFFETLRARLGAPGDFAQAYVVAHEVGHHLQQLMGISAKVDAMRARASTAQGNALSVRLELQADCLAGVWAHHSQKGKNWLEQGDLEEAMNAAAKIGDDALQRRSQGTVVPESFTHGSSEQRMRWFQRGFQGGQLAGCNTFDARAL